MSTRHFKIWHDHSSIAGHSHLLVMIAAIYDPAFYLTSEEVGSNMDIPTIVAHQNMTKPYSMNIVWIRSRIQNLCAHLIENRCKQCGHRVRYSGLHVPITKETTD